MDFIIDLPPNKRIKRVFDAILIMVGKYTKMFRYFCTNKTITEIQFSDIFYKKIIFKHGIFENCVINRESVFTNAVWFEIFYQSRMRRKLNTIFFYKLINKLKNLLQTKV